MAMFYDEAEMAAEREKRKFLERFLEQIGAQRHGFGWAWDPSTASVTKEIREERDKARDEVETLKNDLRLVMGQRGSAERALVDAGWHKPPVAGTKWAPPGTSQAGADVQLAANDRTARAERALLRAGWTYTLGAQDWRPPVGGLAPDLVETLDRIARTAPDNGSFHISSGEVGAIRRGLDSIRAAKPPRCFETVDWLNGEVLDTIRIISRWPDDVTVSPDPARLEILRRAVAAVDQMRAAGATPPVVQVGEWVTDFVNRAVRRDPTPTATVSRHPDPVTPEKLSARMIPFPVLDAIALLAVIDRNSAPYTEGTKAAGALGELEQAVETWFDAHAGGA